MPIWIIGPDSYPHRPLQASFSSRSRFQPPKFFSKIKPMKGSHPPPRDFVIKLCKYGFSNPHGPLQASFSPRSSHIVDIGSMSIVGIVI